MSGPLESIVGGGAWYKCDPPMVLGEAPIYRASDSTLHWVDCLVEPANIQILKVDPETGDAVGKARVIELEDSVTVVCFRKGVPKSYICAYYQGIAFLDEETGKLEIVKEIIPTSKRDELRFNDGGVDAKGRFWLAEIDKKAMAFGPTSFRIAMVNLREDFGVYFNDSVAMKVFAYDFDLESGSIANRRLLVDRSTSYGEPDGMVVDTDGNLWIAVFASHRVMVFDPKGKHLKDIVFPASSMTCTTWGGKDFDIIFATSGKDRSVNAKVDDQGGHMFCYQPKGAKGSAKYEFAG